MRPLPVHFEASLIVRALLPPDGRMLVAVSGGVDSMVLLHLLHQFAARRPMELTVAHAHHQLRGVDSDADAALVEAAATALGVPCRVGRLPVREVHARSPESLEMTARRLRHEFLARTARDLGIHTVALAHHADDQAELVLLRLIRGSGGDGLGGMEWSNPSPADPGIRLIRPLLDVTRAKVQQWASVASIPFREDRSNRDPRFLRNRIRKELLPLLERRFNPSIRHGLIRIADLVGADAAFVADEARRWIEGRRRGAFSSQPVALQRAILRERIRELTLEPGFELVEALRRSMAPVDATSGLRLCRGEDGGVLTVSTPAENPFKRGQSRHRVMSPGGEIRIGDRAVQYRIRPWTKRSRIRPAAGSEMFAAAAVGPVIILRHWRPGDRFQPLGFTGESKLQDIFVNRKVPATRRRGLLVATTGDHDIFWVESLPPGERFRVTDSTRRVLVWKCPPLP